MVNLMLKLIQPDQTILFYGCKTHNYFEWYGKGNNYTPVGWNQTYEETKIGSESNSTRYRKSPISVSYPHTGLRRYFHKVLCSRASGWK